MPVKAKTYDGMTERDLALWMLEQMKDSEEFLADVRAARMKGKRDILDEPQIVDRHKGRLKTLFQGGDDEDVEVPPGVAAKIEGLVARDVLSSREELIEKALAAYIAQHPEAAKDLPLNWQSTIDLARAEVEGRTTGAFREGFVGELAAAARGEMDRQAEVERSREQDREQGRERGD